MANRIFAAFLGKLNYDPCIYEYCGKEAEKTKYIQVALLKIFCKDFSEDDKIRIFVTEDAKSTHWEPSEGSYGLKKEIESLQMKADIKAIDIPDGDSEERLWEIFKKVYDEFDENASIIFDITNGFRSFPLFAMTIINYSHYLKNTTLEGIYYGAFEAGGKQTGKAPIFNITPAFDLMDWTSAANSFTKYGVADELCNKIGEKKELTDSASGLSDSIKAMVRNINYSRGVQIFHGQLFTDCIKKIRKYKSTDADTVTPVLVPILDKVEEKICRFKCQNELNFIPAVQWYIDHAMPAAAISMIKEGVVAYLLRKSGSNYKDVQLRLVLGKRLAYVPEYSYKDNEKRYENKVENIMQMKCAKVLKPIVESFTDFRNDIDHCGFDKSPKNPDDLDAGIREAFAKLKRAFKELENFDDM